MSRAVRLALWDYRPAGALTSSCDKDVESQCPKVCVSGVNVSFGGWRLCLEYGQVAVEHIFVEPVQHLIMHSSCVPAAAWV
jgi:hypothetical protein